MRLAAGPPCVRIREESILCLELIVGRGQFFATRPVYAAKKNLMGTNGSDMTSNGIDKFHVTPVPAMSTHLDSMCISLDFLLSFLPLLLRLFVARDSAKCNSFCRGGNANADFTLGVTNFLIESMHQFCSLEESRSDRI